MDAKTMLDELTELMAQRDLWRMRKQEVVDSIIPPEVKQYLVDLDAEYDGTFAEIERQIAAQEQIIKERVLAEGTTAKGANLMAVFSKGRVSWDSKKLDGMMAIIPGLEKARSVGAPSVSIRKI